LEHKTGIDLTVLLRLKKPSKTIHVYFQTFRIILIHLQSKIKQHLANLAWMNTTL